MTAAEPPTAGELADKYFQTTRRALLLGESGSGKSTLVAALGIELAAQGQDCLCLCCDPGLPAFGPPGTVSLARPTGDGWSVIASEPLCTLDAGRFRLPVLSAAGKLARQVPASTTLLIDSPGLVRGVGAAELIPALVLETNADLCLVLQSGDAELPVANELSALPVQIAPLPPALASRSLSRSRRTALRSQAWDHHLATASLVTVAPQELTLLGTPPPLEQWDAWQGRQVALLHDGEPKTMGDVARLTEAGMELRLAQPPGQFNQLLVRDAVHREGSLRSVPKRPTKPANAENDGNAAVEVRVELGALTSVARDPQVATRVGNVVATLVNGVMGDPLLQVRMMHHCRSLLFDIGDTGRMPLRAAHQVTDLFLTHAHADHIGGFIWLVRSRIGYFPPCRVYGPPGLLEQANGMLNGILWDRVEDRGPCFEIHEWHRDHLKRWRITAGSHTIEPLADQALDDGIVLREPGFVVRATELDHGIPVLAYAYEPRCQINVRKDKLDELGLRAGPWLQDLKRAYLHGQWQQRIQLENGTAPTVDELTQALLLTEPGDKLAYATDFGDSADNVDKLSRLAMGAHTLFCESSFLTEDRDQATRTHHLTTEACARIANRAQVKQLIAFHFSHRYEKRRQRVYEQLQHYTSRLVVPRESVASPSS